MTLDQFLIKHSMSAAEFGRKVNLTRQTIMLYRRGKRFPRGEHLRRILVATGGLVTANDLIKALKTVEPDQPRVPVLHFGG